MSTKFDILTIGDHASYTKTITENDVNRFADLSGDHNPIHTDENYAKSSIFKTRVAHGALVSSLFSTILANQLPGEGTIYMEQNSRFMRPVYLNDTITATVTVEEKIEGKGRVKFTTIAKNQNDEVVITGYAIVKI